MQKARGQLFTSSQLILFLLRTKSFLQHSQRKERDALNVRRCAIFKPTSLQFPAGFIQAKISIRLWLHLSVYNNPDNLKDFA